VYDDDEFVQMVEVWYRVMVGWGLCLELGLILNR
jgi:hypothetical protein